MAREPKTPRSAPRKLIVTETVVAEIVEEEAPPPQPDKARAAAASDEAGTVGLAPGTALASGLMGMFQSASLAAMNSTQLQTQSVITLEASTTQGVIGIYSRIPGRKKN